MNTALAELYKNSQLKATKYESYVRDRHKLLLELNSPSLFRRVAVLAAHGMLPQKPTRDPILAERTPRNDQTSLDLHPPPGKPEVCSPHVLKRKKAETVD